MMSRQECSSYRRSSSEGRSVVSGGGWDHTIKRWQETSKELIWSGRERDRCTPEDHKHKLPLCVDRFLTGGAGHDACLIM